MTGIKVNGKESFEKAAKGLMNEECLVTSTALLDFGVETVIMTLGAEGTLVITKSGSKLIPTDKVKAVV